MQIKKIWNEIKTTIKEEYKFIIALFILYIILQFPLNYYIVTGGGISDISSRIDVAEKNPSKGSFNISYVIERKGTILTYGLSYLIPSWERESVDNYKYTEEDSIEDIEFRSDLDLKTANGQATYWAYTLAKKEVNLTNEDLYVILTFKEYETPLKVQDRIISMDGNSYHSLKEYKDYIQTKEKGSTIKVLVDRKGKELELDVPVYEEKGVSIIGIALQYVKEYETNPDVNIHFRRSESGPSGGLITTLEIYNQLTEKDLTKGYKIAGTGTIEPDGTIGEIGGIEHKILGASRAKADYFLVPKDNYKAAKKYQEEKKLKIKLIEVKTIEDAIEKLENLK